jgi:hypothetical protein
MTCEGYVYDRRTKEMRPCRKFTRIWTGYCRQHQYQYDDKRWATGEEAYAEHTAVY